MPRDPVIDGKFDWSFRLQVIRDFDW